MMELFVYTSVSQPGPSGTPGGNGRLGGVHGGKRGNWGRGNKFKGCDEIFSV